MELSLPRRNSDTSGRPGLSRKKPDRGRLPYFIAGATLTMLLAMTLGTALIVRTIVANQSDDRFDAFAARGSNTIAAELRAILPEAEQVSGLLVGSPEVTVAGFAGFAASLREKGMLAEAVAYVPLVTSSDRAEFEAKIRMQGLRDFELGPAGTGGAQFPLAFVSPIGGAPAPIGSDLYADAGFISAMNLARDTGQPAATGPLADAPHSRIGVVAPIYRSSERIDTAELRREALLGFGLAVYDIETLMAGPLTRAGLSDVGVSIIDRGPVAAAAPVTTPLLASPGDRPSGGSRAAAMIEVAGRDWRFEFLSEPWFGVSSLERNMWAIVLGAGLALTAVATAASYSLASSRQSARSDLRLMSTQLSVFLESALEGIMLVDRDRRVVWTNGALADAFGYVSAEELLGMTSPEVERAAAAAVQDVEGMVGRIIEIYADESLTVPSEDIVFAGSTPVTYARTSVPVTDQDGEYRGRLWVYRDVTGERAAEQAKGVFVSMVSHELRTPLTSVIGFLELVVSGAAGPITSETERLLGMARRSSERLKRLVNDILDVSRLEGGIRIELAAVNLTPLVAELLDNVRGEFESRNLTFQVSVPPGLPRVSADASRLFQVLMNLLTNAYRYTPEGGKVILAARAVGDKLEIAVSDTGVGIPEEDRPRVFERFVRVESSARKSQGSTGLGLAIAKSLTELQGGSIEMSSEVGRGTTFRVLLRQADAVTPAPAADTAAA